MRPLVLLFSIDGMRPDALVLAETPTLDRLVKEGASTMKARTVMPSVTLPCHTSMFRGVDVPRHGITSNTFSPLARPVPSIIDVATQQGRRCAMFYNWGPLRDLCGPESLAFSYFVGDLDRHEGDEHVARVAAEHLASEDIDFAFIYLGYTDIAGHAHGWMSPEYIEGIRRAAPCVQQVLDAAVATGRPVTALVQSDHGGHERSHGTEMPEDMTIPWVLWGDRVRRGFTIEAPVRIFDTCTTLAHLLDLNPAREWEGRIVSEALD